MATWIAHLRIAERLLPLYPDIDVEQFAIGHVAPDSGVPSADWRIYDPPREVTHCQRRDPPGEHGLEDMAFYHEHLSELGVARCQSPRHAFLLGYWMHLVTDNLWRQTIWRPQRARYASQFETLHALIVALKRDWYGLDRLYLAAHPESLFWRVFLDAEYRASYLDAVPAEAIRIGLQQKKDYYLDEAALAEARAHTYPYLTEEGMDAFCTLAIDRLTTLVALIDGGSAPVDSAFSALDLLCTGASTP